MLCQNGVSDRSVTLKINNLLDFLRRDLLLTWQIFRFTLASRLTEKRQQLAVTGDVLGLGGSLKGTIIANELSSNPEDPMTKKLSRRNMVAAALFAPAAGSSVALAQSAAKPSAPDTNRKFWTNEYWAQKNANVKLYMFRKRASAPKAGEAQIGRAHV